MNYLEWEVKALKEDFLISNEKNIINEQLITPIPQTLKNLTPLKSTNKAINIETLTETQSPLKPICEGSLLNEIVHFTEEERKILKIQMEQVINY